MSQIAVIIPAFNECKRIAAALAALDVNDVVIADGGSRDGTAESAAAAGAKVIVKHGARGTALNLAASKCAGDMLLFLHADTELPADWQDCVRQTLADPSVALGAFSLGIADARPAERLIARAATIRSRLFGLPYGDQALFLRRRTFEVLGGFGALPIMEDFDLVRRARRLGRIVTLPQRVETSARRWRTKGVLRTTAINQAMLAGWMLGVSPERLAAFYRRVR
jgi:rSAM/selenodomain-associated transferase 2|tara:strand:+ start:51976 stop:52647 length:672 start_codon:yes stop_codon:yes gene_type:complete